MTLRKLMCGWARLCVMQIDSRSPSFLSVNISPFSARWDETSMGRAAGGAADSSSSSVMSLKCSQLLRLRLVKLTLMQLWAFQRWKGTSKLSCLQYAKQGKKKQKLHSFLFKWLTVSRALFCNKMKVHLQGCAGFKISVKHLWRRVKYRMMTEGYSHPV